jgi:hypothetical protein
MVPVSDSAPGILEQLERSATVHEVLAVFEAEQRRLEDAIADARRRLDAARSADAALPGLGDLIRRAHHELARMEAGYRDAVVSVLREADATAARVIDDARRSS